MPLTRSFDLFQSCLLEASAGTGKTFTITHLFVRFLLAKIPLDQILVVTFTKAAVSELKGRIRQQIRETLVLLQEGGDRPDYLQDCALEEGVKILQKALLTFEESAIMTIHAFCARMLASSGLLGIIEENSEGLFKDRLQFLVHDTIYAGLEKARIKEDDIAQMGSGLAKIENHALRYLKENKTVDHNFKSFETLYKENSAKLTKLLHSVNLREEFEKIAPYYNGIKNPEKALACLEDIAFEGLTFSKFVKLLYNAAPFLQIREDNRNKRKKTAPPSSLFEQLQPLLYEIVHSNNEDTLIAALLNAVQDVKVQAPHHFKSQDDVLKNMLSALKMPRFLETVRASFSVAIIDEFQDTDPLQWQIFSTCFLPDKPCFLVGDPKQSIYSFRKADVYTYLHAASLTNKKVILNTNWRSTPELVGAFNALFCHKKWLTLPKNASHLEAPLLIAGQKSASLPDGKGAVHFLLLKGKLSKKAQEALFFEEMAAEISNLKMPLSDIAILVSDRSQAKRLETYLKKKGFLTANWQRLHKDDDEQDLAFKLFLEALLKPFDKGLVKAALMTPLFRWTVDDVRSSAFIAAQEEFFHLKEMWQEKGFGSALSHLFSATSLTATGERSLAEDLDSFAEGQKILLETKHQAEELLHEDWMRYPHLPEQLLENYDKRISAPRKGREGINILTTHASKGLEFSVVFALSLAFGSYKAEEFFSFGDKIALANKASPEYELFLQEKDAEKLRQLYVAMTRAKKRLYLPYTLSEKEAAPGKAAPLDLFIKSQVETDVEAYLQSLQEKASITYAFIEGQRESSLLTEVSSSSLLQAPLPLSLQIPSRRLLSFTALAKKGTIEPLISKEGMPSSGLVGELLHHILEVFPFEKGSSLEAIEAFIKPFLVETILEAWQAEVASMIYAVFQLPLQGFTLRDVEAHKVMREMEFLHKTPQHYLKGFIDMAFEYKGDYYLIDWKSNLLPDYGEESLKKAMASSDYFLQASIYRDAFCTYLEQFGLAHRFKGLFYIFLRGPAVYYVP